MIYFPFKFRPIMKLTYLPVLILSIIFFCLNIGKIQAQTDPNHPNILLIIADDMGIDALNGYQNSQLLPSTPNLDALRAQGLTFDNVWAAPQCTPTRAAIMSGKHGIKTGVTRAPGNLDPNQHISIFRELATQTDNTYADALIGKWHISNPQDYTHPAQHGVDMYTGSFGASPSSYYSWQKIVNQTPTTNTDYITTSLNNDAIGWINAQNQPWLLWLAHIAPHAPFHTPPDSMYTLGGNSSNTRNYMRAIEAMDFSIGRLLDNIPQAVRDNTVIIFVGDNGTPNAPLQNYPTGRGKASLYQGGLNVPMIVSGKGVTRTGEREDALVHVTDIYATVLEIGGADLPGGIYNSLSFKHKLDNSPGNERPYNYIEYSRAPENGWAIRDAQYKYIEFDDGRREFYDLLTDSFELVNLYDNLTPTQQDILAELEAEGAIIRNDWSCNDFIQNGMETAIDEGSVTCGDATCNTPSDLNFTNTGCCVVNSTPSLYDEIVYQDVRMISSNNFPNHDYCFSAAHTPAPLNRYMEVDATPEIAATTTSVLSSTNRPDRYFGIGLNGVIFAPAPATPFIFENQNTGEFNWDWVFEPTNNQGAGSDWVSLDCASAHTGPQGYHYHGNMFEYAETISPGLTTITTPPAEPVQVGWASDGFPILYRFGPDGVGGLSLLQPSFQLKSGDRPGDGITAPCGPYNGKYTNDYEYVPGSGDLDECNGVQRTINLQTQHGQETFDYFYVVTDSFPQISRCMVGTPDLTFDNGHQQAACYTSLVSQTVTLAAGGSVNVGSSTYTQAGIYQDILTNSEGCDSIIITEIDTYVDITLKAFLEGAYDPAIGEMKTVLNTRGILPGQTPFSAIATPTPSGQPYHIVPWNYSGTEGGDWTDSDYSGDETDWMLVSFRTETAKNTEIAITAAIVKKDGTFHFPNRGVLSAGVADSVYIVIEHRNHIGVMTPQALEITNGVLAYDFTLNDSYRDATGFGQKQLSTGEWVMFAGDASQLDMPSFDINGTDKSIWSDNNGNFDYYSSPDFNLDGDVNGQDKSFWFENNGISSRVPK